MKKPRNRLSLVLLNFYKNGISPFLPHVCRFHPSCSIYAIGCYQRFSFFKASWLTIKRLSRCQPFHPGGDDPVPEK